MTGGKNGLIPLQLYHAASNELEATQDLLVLLWQHDTIERTASFLVTLAGKCAGSDGMKIETHSRALRKLCQHQFIEMRGRSEIYIKDLDGLRMIAAQAYGSDGAGETADATPEAPLPARLNHATGKQRRHCQ
jgi:hypothetical protein